MAHPWGGQPIPADPRPPWMAGRAGLSWGFRPDCICAEAIGLSDYDHKLADIPTQRRRKRPDLMIVDGGLGRGSGVSAVEEILRAGPLAHLFVSGNAERVQTRQPDAVVVRKPFREAELARAIDMALAAVPQPALAKR